MGIQLAQRKWVNSHFYSGYGMSGTWSYIRDLRGEIKAIT